MPQRAPTLLRDPAADRAPTHRRDILPLPRTALVGRRQETEAVLALLRRDDVGLVTLTGPGGVGKTRLALAVAQAARADFADGVVFVPLAAITSAEGVAAAIAQALELREQPEQATADALAAVLRYQEMLLLLDNFEQVLPAGPLLASLLGCCPGLTLLVTSRERLRLSDEHEVPVAPLALPPAGAGGGGHREAMDAPAPPDPAEDLDPLDYAAARLFLERARAVQPHFAPANGDALAIGEICRRLDGLPLAIELAATAIKLHTPRGLLARLEQRLPVLTGGPRDLPARQQTLRDTIRWSYDLLDEAERALFRRLSVFAGGFTVAAAVAVCAEGNEPGATVGRLGSLLDKSLVQRAAPGDGDADPRLTMLGTIREFAAEQLAEAGERDRLRCRHARWCLELVATLAGADGGESWETWRAEEHNLAAAFRWGLESGDLALCARLMSMDYGWMIHRGASFVETARRLLARPDDLPSLDRARLRSMAGLIAVRSGDLATAVPWLDEAAGYFRDAGDDYWLGQALAWLARALVVTDPARARATVRDGLRHTRLSGHPLLFPRVLVVVAAVDQALGDAESARAALEECLAGLDGLGDVDPRACRFLLWRDVRVDALGRLARLDIARGDVGCARTRLEEALPLCAEAGDLLMQARTLGDLGLALLAGDDPAGAAARFGEGLLLCAQTGNLRRASICLNGLGVALSRLGRYGWAARSFGAADAVSAAAGEGWERRVSRSDPARRLRDEVAPSLRDALGADAYEREYAAGRSLTVPRAFAAGAAWREAPPLAAVPPVVAPAADVAAGLTAREREVLAAIARGWTNRQIAEGLVISVRTVERHIDAIYSKLGIRGKAARVAAARVAADHGLAVG